MIKESILFVASTGLLIYFIAPSEESAKPEPVTEETQEASTPVVQSPDNAWDYEDEDDEEESFTFGEPITNLDDDVEEPSSYDEEDSSNREKPRDDSKQKNTSQASSNKTASGNGPVGSEKGSVDNPIVFKTNNPANPEDD